MDIQRKHNSCRSNTISLLLAWALCSTFFMPAEGEIYPKNGVILSLQAAIEEVQKAQALTLSVPYYVTRTRDQIALQDCLQLFEDTLHRLNGSLNTMKASRLEKKAAMADVHTWVSAALTNQHMCLGGLSGTNYNRDNKSSIVLSEATSFISMQVFNLSRLIGDSLALFVNLLAGLKAAAAARKEGDLVHARKRGGKRRRRLLQLSRDVVVAQDGSGDYRTITEALNAYVAPPSNESYFVIYVKAGEYYENVVIGQKLNNLMLIGDGMNTTFVVGNKSSLVSHTLYASATFVVWPDGFIARDITFANTAGPQEFQAVSLLLVGDRAVFYRCGIHGYQDTLLLHSNRHFFRRCHISGTVDFIFGNSVAVIQKSTILVRRPLDGQVNTITAQGRTNASQNSGIIIHNCIVKAAPELAPVQHNFKTYLGRPWQRFSRTVVMQSELRELIDPAGWLQWDDEVSDLSSVYYGEFRNVGGGADTSKRVEWPGFRVIRNLTEAQQFSVGNFFGEDSWISRSGVPFFPSLNRL